MDELIEAHPGKWLLVAGPRSLRHTMSALISRLAEVGPVDVLDGANQFDAYAIARSLRGRPELLQRIQVARMFTCYQVLASLEKATRKETPFIVLNLLGTFYDEAVNYGERRRLLDRSIQQLVDLSARAAVLVSVQPPAQISPQAQTLFTILYSAAPEASIQEMPVPAPGPLRLF